MHGLKKPTSNKQLNFECPKQAHTNENLPTQMRIYYRIKWHWDFN